MVSAWWILWAFIGGGYAGALVVALMSMSGDRSDAAERTVAERAAPQHHARRGGHLLGHS